MKIVKHFYSLLLFTHIGKGVVTSIKSKFKRNNKSLKKNITLTAPIGLEKINPMLQWPDRPEEAYY